MRICNVENCGKQVTARGLCNTHYQMWYQGYDMPATSPTGAHGNKQQDIIITRPSPMELGWLIGLLEGEGHFSYANTQQLVVGMTDKDIVYKLKALLERILNTNKPIHIVITNWRVEEKTMYTIRLYGAKARAIMLLIVKHMGDRRRQQIWKALNGYTNKNLRLADLLKKAT